MYGPPSKLQVNVDGTVAVSAIVTSFPLGDMNMLANSVKT